MDAQVDLFSSSVSDIPEGTKLLKRVGNRPYPFMSIALVGVLILGLFMYRYWFVFVAIAVALVVLTCLTRNVPVIGIYEGLLVCHRTDNSDAICIIPNERIVAWNTVSTYDALTQVYFVGSDEKSDELPDLSEVELLCINIHSINAYGLQSALKQYYFEKSMTEIRRQEHAERESNDIRSAIHKRLSRLKDRS